MWSLLLQSLVLLLAAYFVGVWIGCMARRLIAPPKSQTSGQPLQSTPPQPAVTASPAQAPAAPAVQVTPEQPALASQSVDPALQAAAAASAAVATAVSAQQVVAAQSASESAAAPASVAQQIQSIGTSADPVAARSHIKPEPFPDGRLPAAVGGGGDAASSVAAVVAQPEPEAPAPRPLPQDLTAIQGIDAATAVVLEREGVTRYEQLPAWKEGDVARINRALGGMRRVQEQNWIEQAKILASGGLTAYARRRKASAAAGAPSHTQIVQPTPDQGDAVSLSATSASSSPAAAAGASMLGAAANSLVTADVVGDDLTAIDGITPEIARLLKEQGLKRYAQIARLDDAAANRLNGLLGIEQRVQKQHWAAQAAALSGSTPNTTAAPTVQSAPTAAVAAAAMPATAVGSEEQPGAQNTSTPDDNLMRIRGVGDVIERKLRSLGFSTYASIADWREHDVRKVSEALDFRGRIERENWIEQARILASGGQTEFSRRFDSGE